MKYFGFFKEHSAYPFAKTASEFIGDYINPDRDEVIEYLKKGFLCIAWMGFADDIYNPAYVTGDADFIGYTAIDTDGEYFWPQYYQGYIEKYPNMIINPYFVQHVKKMKEKNISLSDAQISKLEKQFIAENQY